MKRKPPISEKLQEILTALQEIQPHAQTEAAKLHLEKIKATIHAFDDQFPDAPIMEVLVALHDAISYKDLGLTYTAQQYQKAYDILTKTAKVEKKLKWLGRAGFDLIPYEITL